MVCCHAPWFLKPCSFEQLDGLLTQHDPLKGGLLTELNERERSATSALPRPAPPPPRLVFVCLSLSWGALVLFRTICLVHSLYYVRSTGCTRSMSTWCTRSIQYGLPVTSPFAVAAPCPCRHNGCRPCRNGYPCRPMVAHSLAFPSRVGSVTWSRCEWSVLSQNRPFGWLVARFEHVQARASVPALHRCGTDPCSGVVVPAAHDWPVFRLWRSVWAETVRWHP
jgi:hypothetical protein